MAKNVARNVSIEIYLFKHKLSFREESKVQTKKTCKYSKEQDILGHGATLVPLRVKRSLYSFFSKSKEIIKKLVRVT